MLVSLSDGHSDIDIQYVVSVLFVTKLLSVFYQILERGLLCGYAQVSMAFLVFTKLVR